MKPTFFQRLLCAIGLMYIEVHTIELDMNTNTNTIKSIERYGKQWKRQ